MWIKKLPWFYVLFTFYPLLFLWTINLSEIDPAVVMRPFLFTLVGSAILYGVLYLILRNSQKVSLVGTLVLIAFFTYGHIYNKTRTVPALEFFSHHRILIPIYLVIVGLGIWAVLRRFKENKNLFRVLTVVGLVLVGIQVFQISYFYIQDAFMMRNQVTQEDGVTLTATRKNLPDVYFIVLDTYMRADALEQEMGYDNSAFIKQLKDLGFYVAECSRPNYGYTQASIATTLNMNYLPEVEAMTGITLGTNDQWASELWPTAVKTNLVQRQLEEIGYKVVGFRSEFPWLELDHPDAFLGLDRPSIASKYIYPFEFTYSNSTALAILNALENEFNFQGFYQKVFSDQENVTPVLEGATAYVSHYIDMQFFILSKLREIPAMEGPKFTYAHIMIPHDPYVFGPDGEIVPVYYDFRTDDGEINGELEGERQGYLNGVSFINDQMLSILADIISQSDTPPIIILEGDHGFRDHSMGRYAILNAYYLPDGYEGLYPNITPVNSFRLIFDEYFGADYPLLPDMTYDKLGEIVNETYPDCSVP